MNHILEFHCWACFTVKDSGLEYYTASSTSFDHDWLDSIKDEYSMEYPKVTSQSTESLVTIPSFIGTNWYEVKSHMVQLFVTCIGAAGIPFSYLIRGTFQDWENTNRISSLQDSITATKIHSGNSFDIDDKDLFCILSNTFSATALEDVILSHHRTQNDTMEWKIIKANVEGARYTR